MRYITSKKDKQMAVREGTVSLAIGRHAPRKWLRSWDARLRARWSNPPVGSESLRDVKRLVTADSTGSGESGTGGEGGIRTLGALLELGALAKLCFRPLSHLTGFEAGNPEYPEISGKGQTPNRAESRPACNNELLGMPNSH